MAVSLVFGVLWLATVLASNISVGVITLFWLVVAAIIFVWSIIENRDRAPWADVALSMLKRNEAEVFDVHASAFVAFEQIDDEGAFYAFQVDDDRIVFVGGQEFGAVARFPSLDFSIIHVLDEEGMVRSEWLEKRGARAASLRTISANIKRSLALPDHLTIVEGRVQEIEAVYARFQTGTD